MTNETASRWLRIGGAYGVVAGLGLIALALLPELGLEAIVQTTFWPHPEAAGAVGGAVRLPVAVSGALTTGWGLIAWWLGPLVGRPGTGACCGVFARAFIAWFVLDSTASVLVGAPLNVVGNVTFVIALLPPLLAVWRGVGEAAR